MFADLKILVKLKNVHRTKTSSKFNVHHAFKKGVHHAFKNCSTLFEKRSSHIYKNVEIVFKNVHQVF